MSRKFHVYGNWKLHNNIAASRALADAVVSATADSRDRVVTGMAPVFTSLAAVRETVPAHPHLMVLGQNGYPAPKGAFTGEISFALLKDLGCDGVILGHSERRQIFHETDAFINEKVQAALATNLQVVFCVGETLEERESGRTWEVVGGQIDAVLPHVAADLRARLIVAYEPVWAIGTGRTATPAQAQEVHKQIRDRIAQLWDATAAAECIIQYGGSVKADNAAELFACPDIDGGLVGGAALDAAGFAKIIAAAAAIQR
ncbi:triose-phosphate isomerase [Myxococcota bacterium]|nr:triose-phosphate isomerase [Myxococcota bacterium]